MEKKSNQGSYSQLLSDIVNSLNKKNKRAKFQEIDKVINEYGHEAYVYLLKFLFNDVNLSYINSSPQNQVKIDLLTQEFSRLAESPNFVSIIVEVFDSLSFNTPLNEFFVQLSKTLNLPVSQQVMFGLALAQSPNQNTQKEGVSLLRTKFDEMLENEAEIPENIAHELILLVNKSYIFTPSEQNKINTVFKKNNSLKNAGAFASPNELSNSQQNYFFQQQQQSSSMQSNPNSLQQQQQQQQQQLQQQQQSYAGSVVDENFLSVSLKELGPIATYSNEIFSKILDRIQNLTPAGVAKAIALMSIPIGVVFPNQNPKILPESFGIDSQSVPTSELKGWNTEIFVNGITKKMGTPNWKNIFSCLDIPNYIPTQSTFEFAQQIYTYATKQPIFPLEVLVSKTLWKNVQAQLILLKLFIDYCYKQSATDPNFMSEEYLLSKEFRVVNLGALKTVVPKTSTFNIWMCLDLIEALLEIGSMLEHYVRMIFEIPLKNWTGCIAVGIAEAKPSKRTLQDALLLLIVPQFVKPQKNSYVVLRQIFNVNPSFLLTALKFTYRQDPTSIRRIVDIGQELRVLPGLTEISDLDPTLVRFCIELAVLSAKRDHLNLEYWLNQNISQYKTAFVGPLLNFLADQIAQIKDSGQFAICTIDDVAIIVKCLQNPQNADYVSPFGPKFPQILQTLTAQQQDEISNKQGFRFSHETEEKANKFFKDMFVGTMSVDDGINILKSLNASKKQDSQTLFACIIHNLFDEYRFLHQYPLSELKVMAKMFGSLIQQNVLTGKSQKVPMTCILQSLMQPANENLVQFGLIALDQFKTRISEWPDFCAELRRIPAVQSMTDLSFYMSQVPSPASTGANPTDLEGLAAALSGSPIGSLSAIAQFQAQLLPGLSSPPPTGAAGGTTLLGNQTGLPTLTPSPLTIGTSTTITSIVPTSTTPIPTPNVQIPSPSGSPVPSPTSSPPPSDVIPKLDEEITGGSQESRSLDSEDAKDKKDSQKKGATTITGIQNSLDTSTLDMGVVVNPPDEKTGDRLRFLINNLTEVNVKEKAEELKEITKPEMFSYFSHYLVKRVSVEPNNHEIYSELLKLLNLKVLDEEIRKYTYVNIFRLLESEKISQGFSSERKLLVNLGSWLGLVTIARNNPILQRDLDLKAVIIQAYDEGKLIGVIPFVSKILMNCAKSKVFKPPNPWVVGLISILVEIHDRPEFRMNIKLEVESLCSALNLNINDVQKKNILQTRPLPKNPNNPDINPKNFKVIQFNFAPLSAFTPQSDVLERIKIDERCSIFLQNPELKKTIIIALEKAIRTVVEQLVKRCTSIATQTTVDLVTKDFVADPDPQRLKQAAIIMAQHLAVHLAIVSAKEPLRMHFTKFIESEIGFIVIGALSEAQKAQITEQAAIIAGDNSELGYIFIESATQERVADDISEALAPEIQQRQKFQTTGAAVPFSKIGVVQYQQTLPEVLFSPRGLLPHQLKVYESFLGGRPFPNAFPANMGIAQNPQVQVQAPPAMMNIGVGANQPSSLGSPIKAIPLGQKLLTPTRILNQPGMPMSPAPEVVQPNQEELKKGQLLDKVNACMDVILKQCRAMPKNVPLKSLPANSQVISNILLIPNFVKQLPYDMVMSIAHTLISQFYDTDSLILRDIYITLLHSTQNVCKRIVKETTNLWAKLAEEKRFSAEHAILLFEANVLVVTDVDTYVEQFLKQASNTSLVVKFAIDVLFSHCILKKKLFSLFEVQKTFTYFFQNAQLHALLTPADKEVILRLQSEHNMQKARKFNSKYLGDVISYQDLLEIRKDVVNEYGKWKTILANPPEASTNAEITAFVTHLLGTQMKKAVDCEKFFTLVLSDCVNSFRALMSRKEQQQYIATEEDIFIDVDQLSKLFFEVIKMKSSYLELCLKTISKFLLLDHDVNRTAFNQRVYLRLISNLFLYLYDEPTIQAPENPFSSQYPFFFAEMLRALQPFNVPGFVFAWLELISHRAFMPKLLNQPKEGWAAYHSLLLCWLRYLELHLKYGELKPAIVPLYKGTLKLFLVLLHDFSEFLSAHAFSLCDYIPSSCVQMRNLVLSAFPSQMKLMDPTLPGWKIEDNPEIRQPPLNLFNYLKVLDKTNLRKEIDQFMASGTPSNFPQKLQEKLYLTAEEALVRGTPYNTSLLNALVLYCGSCDNTTFNPNNNNSTSQKDTPTMQIFKTLALELDPEGRYNFFSALANQLRYPSTHTFFFCNVLMSLFSEPNLKKETSSEQQVVATPEAIQEQISRVLIERLSTNKPFPWGLLVAFIQLLKNPRSESIMRKLVGSVNDPQMLNFLIKK